ncbi:MAG: hypothetical protein PVG35_17450, partial [Desulfobacterales bacterium]
ADKTVSFQRTTNILIVDNATWHRRKDIHWHRWQPKYLPPYSPGKLSLSLINPDHSLRIGRR